MKLFKYLCIKNHCTDILFWVLVSENQDAPTQIDNGISQTIRNCNKISMTKNLFSNVRIETTVTAEYTSFKRNTVNAWPNYGYFGQQPCDFGVDKDNLPENTILYLSQDHQSWKDNKKIFYGDYFILGQVNECLDPPENLKTYEPKDREVILYRPRYDTVTDHFEGIYETLGYIMVRGDSNEHFLDYGFCKKNSKILYSYHEKRMPSSFTGTFFNRHGIQCKSGALNTDFSEVFFFLPSMTDCIEEINRYKGSVNLFPIDIQNENFEVDGMFDPSKLDYSNPDKEKARQAVVKILKKLWN